jgi:hypothetical protein
MLKGSAADQAANIQVRYSLLNIHPEGGHMNRRLIALSSLALTGSLALSGCAAAAVTEPSAAPSVAPAAAASTTDAESCTGFNDVLTITTNAEKGFRDARMAEQEQMGWYRLATRILDGVPTSGEGAVSDAIAALKSIAPEIKLGSIEPTEIGSTEWNSSVQDLSTACAAAGTEMAVESYTGG